ncbi:MAG: sigma-70 family RNA polymerase sigma factor [Cyclobacteriaceae bacterium]
MSQFIPNIRKYLHHSEKVGNSPVTEKPNEIHLWDNFRSGEDSAFIKIYETYFPTLYSYGHQFTNDSDLIKDSIQEFFIELRNNRNRLGDTTSVKAYFFKSMRRRLLRALAKKKYLLYDGHLEKDFDFEITLSWESILINNQIEAEKKNKLDEAFTKLTKRQKEAIIYFYYEGLSYEEIASIMNLAKVKYARTLVYRSIDKLKEEIY